MEREGERNAADVLFGVKKEREEESGSHYAGVKLAVTRYNDLWLSRRVKYVVVF